MSETYGAGSEAPQAPTCYQHPGRSAGAECRRCGRPICPECMREAPVGWQCSSCVGAGTKSSPVIRWRPSGVGRGGRGGQGPGGRGTAGTLGATRLTPVTLALIAVNVIVYAIESRHMDSVITRFGLLPYSVHYQGQWYRLLTAAFLHASVEHIAFNMITLAIVGPALEAAVGPVRFTAIYLVAALGGSVASYLLSPQFQYGVGASGAIFGLMGAYFILARRNGWDASTILILIVFNLGLSFIDTTIDWRAHVGGLVTGAVMSWSLAEAGEHWVRSAMIVTAALGVLALLTLIPPGHINL